MPHNIILPANVSVGDPDGSFTTFTPTGTFTWGTIYAATEKTLTLTADAGSLPAACKLVFTGDDTAFAITEIEGEVLATPVLCSAVGDDLRFLAWEQGFAATIKLQPVFGDGTAKSMTMDVQAPDGTSVAAFTVSATFADAVVGAVQAAGSVLSHWTCQDIATGAKIANDQVAENLADADANYQLYTADATKEVVAGLLEGIGSSRSVSRYIKSTTSGVGKAVGIKVAQVGELAGWFIVRMDFTAGWTSFVKTARGTYTAPTVTTYSRAVMRTGFIGPRFSSLLAVAGTKAIFCAYRYDGASTYWRYSDMQGAWADVGSVTIGGDQIGDGVAWFNDRTNSGKDFRLLPGSMHTADIGDAALEAIYNACKVA